MKYKKGKNLKLIGRRSIFIGSDVVIGDNVVIYENNRIEGKTVIGDNVVLKPNNYILDCTIGNETVISESQAEKSQIGKNCKIGPWSRIRPDSVIGDEVHIGNFVEIKNAKIGNGTKACHLAYVGDCDIGENCNIGCGAIFVNYNGKTKNRTKVGDNCFIGSNCNIIAPVTIENNGYICAGTTVTESTEDDDFVIGRVRQEVKAKRAHEYLKNYKESK